MITRRNFFGAVGAALATPMLLSMEGAKKEPDTENWFNWAHGQDVGVVIYLRTPGVIDIISDPRDHPVKQLKWISPCWGSENYWRTTISRTRVDANNDTLGPNPILLESDFKVNVNVVRMLFAERRDARVYDTVDRRVNTGELRLVGGPGDFVSWSDQSLRFGHRYVNGITSIRRINFADAAEYYFPTKPGSR